MGRRIYFRGSDAYEPGSLVLLDRHYEDRAITVAMEYFPAVFSWCENEAVGCWAMLGWRHDRAKFVFEKSEDTAVVKMMWG